MSTNLADTQGGGTMFCGKGFKNAKPLFHDAISKRGGVLMHAKVRPLLQTAFELTEQHLVALFQPKPRPLGFEKSNDPPKTAKRKASVMEDDVSQFGGWIYIGSHNFTPSAWAS